MALRHKSKRKPLFSLDALTGEPEGRLLAFLLGVCVTVLCFRLRQMNREDDQNKESEGIHGAD